MIKSPQVKFRKKNVVQIFCKKFIFSWLVLHCATKVGSCYSAVQRTTVMTKVRAGLALVACKHCEKI